MAADVKGWGAGSKTSHVRPCPSPELTGRPRLHCTPIDLDQISHDYQKANAPGTSRGENSPSGSSSTATRAAHVMTDYSKSCPLQNWER